MKIKFRVEFASLPFSPFSDVKDIIETFGSHLNIDLQQRGVEFSQLFGNYNHLREALLEKMPAMTINRLNGANGNGEVEVPEIHMPSEKAASNGRSNTDTLLDLLGSGDDIIMQISTPAAVQSNQAPAATSNLLDLLGDIDLSAPAAPVMMSNNNNNNVTLPVTLSILDDNENTKLPDGSVFNGGSAPVNYDLGLDFLAPSTTTAKIVTAFDKNDLLVQLATVIQSDHLQIVMTTTNNSIETLDQYLFQVRTFVIKLRIAQL